MSLVLKKLYRGSVVSHFESNLSTLEIPKIDFEKSTVIGVFAGVIAYLGQSINIKHIVENNFFTTVEVQSSDLKSGCLRSSAFETVLDIVTIPKTNKPIIFKEVMIEKFCNE